jgi:hypothetical protein
MANVDLLDSLERAVNEIDALEAIYGSDEEITDDSSSGGCKFLVVSKVELDSARSLVERAERLTDSPVLEIEIRRQIQSNSSTNETQDITLRCRLPSGYPEVPVKVSISVGGLTRSKREEISLTLQGKADSLAGQEAVMDLVDEFKEIAVACFSVDEQDDCGMAPPDESTSRISEKNSRRWIWVHHITNPDRRKSILAEARGLDLGGFLKTGYPGVMVIEGSVPDCNEFVSWVKGNKSRPGGFGRNWGHHVRGHLDFDSIEDRKFSDVFEELEAMADLGRECKERGAEEEFKVYVLQHRGSD